MNPKYFTNAFACIEESNWGMHYSEKAHNHAKTLYERYFSLFIQEYYTKSLTYSGNENAEKDISELERLTGISYYKILKPFEQKHYEAETGKDLCRKKTREKRASLYSW